MQAKLFLLCVVYGLMGVWLGGCDTESSPQGNRTEMEEPEPTEPEPSEMEPEEPESGEPAPMVDACEEDADCVGGDICTQEGECVEAECEEQEGCEEGSVCEDGRCVSLGPVICEVNTSRCEDSAAVRCVRGGTGEEREECEEDARCVEGDEGAMCVAIVCVPGSMGCVDRDMAFVCNEEGTEQVVSPCDEAQFCQDGLCLQQVCEPGEVVCSGTLLRTCNALGTEFLAEDCLAPEVCAQGDFGCSCRQGACVARVCRPGESVCVGENVSQRCAEDGLSLEEMVVCGEGQFCQAGECLDTDCQALTASCAGDVLLTCGFPGERMEQDCREQGLICTSNIVLSSCATPVCEPEARFCQENISMQCNVRGSAVLDDTIDCTQSHQVCREGHCVDGCDPGVGRCVGSRAFLCMPDGMTESEELCEGSLECQEGRCVDPDGVCPTALAQGRRAGEETFVSEMLVVTALRVVELDGRMSSDLYDDEIVAYSWSLIERPEGSATMLLPGSNEASPLLVPDLPGRYVLELEVTDERDMVSCEVSRFVVMAQMPEDGFHVLVTWEENRTDLDLHLLHPNGRWNAAPWDCFRINRTPDWGVLDDASDDPIFARDDTDGFGPEQVSLDRPEALEYRVGVHHFSRSTGPPSTASVQIWFGNTRMFESQSRALSQDDFWTVAAIAWGDMPQVREINAVANGFPVIGECDVDNDCAVGFCVNSACVDCREDNHCDGAQTCVGNDCVACVRDAECDEGMSCLGGMCDTPLACTDDFEPNNNRSEPVSLNENGPYEGLTLCDRDEDHFSLDSLFFPIAGSVTLTYTPASATPEMILTNTFDMQEIGRATGADGTASLSWNFLIGALPTLSILSSGPEEVTYTLTIVQ